jgi:hypothetical protein
VQLETRFVCLGIGSVVGSYLGLPGEHFLPAGPSISCAPAHFVQTNTQYLLEVLSRLYRPMRYSVAWRDVVLLPRALALDFRSVVDRLQIAGRLKRAGLRLSTRGQWDVWKMAVVHADRHVYRET